ncbi:MAG: tetratricopeptide repeat protein [Methylobacter sp.]|nr:MAG: tetratricopeptide repeat protein [Methylobacter sp.]
MNNSFETLVQQASAKLQALDFGDAAELYNEALRLKPNNGAAQMGLAMVYNHIGESGKALQILQTIWTSIQTRIAEQQPVPDKNTQAELLAQIGIAQHQLGQLDQALASYKQAFSLCPSEPLKIRINSLTNAVAAATPFEQLLTYAQKNQANGLLDEAIKAYKAALQLNPDSDRALHGLGNALRQQGDFQAAIPFIQQAIIMQPEIAEYHNTLGMLFQQKGEFEKAITFHQRAISLDSKYAAAFCNLGVALKNLDRATEAVAAYQQALQINPNMPEVHNNLGNLLRRMGDVVGAQASLEQALKIHPNYPDAEQNLKELLDSLKSTAKKPRAKPAAKKTSTAKEKTGTVKEKSTTAKEKKAVAKATKPTKAKETDSVKK